MQAGRRGQHQKHAPGHAVSPSSAQRDDLLPAPVPRRPPPSTTDNGRLRSDSLRQPPAAPAMLLVRPVHLSRSSAMRAVNALPPDRVVRTAVLQLANPGREPFFQGGENQPPSLASAFFPSDEKVSQRACGRQSEGREAKGLSWLQWLLANFLILLVAATVVLAVFGQRVFTGSGSQGAVGTTAGFVVLPEVRFRKPPPVALPRPMHREAESDRKRNLPPKTSEKSTRRRTINSFKKVTRSRREATSLVEDLKSVTDD